MIPAKEHEKSSRRSQALIIIIALAVLFVVPVDAVAGFYPGRPIYDYNKYAPHSQNCDNPSSPEFDHGRCGPTDGPVFNSFINVPSYGDERSFFDARRTDRRPDTNNDPLRNVTQSKELTLRVFIDNDANEFFGYKETALNTTVRVALPAPTLAGYDLRAVASVGASNANPETVEDSADFTDARKFRVEYVPGSARLLKGDHSMPISDEIVKGGALVSSNGDPGVFEPGFSKEALVELRVRVRLVHVHHVAQSIGVGVAGGLFVFLLIPATRRLIARRTRSAWQRFRNLGLHLQIATNLFAAGVLALLGWLIKVATSG
jgi:hypothetical protein